MSSEIRIANLLSRPRGAVVGCRSGAGVRYEPAGRRWGVNFAVSSECRTGCHVPKRVGLFSAVAVVGEDRVSPAAPSWLGVDLGGSDGPGARLKHRFGTPSVP